MLNAPAIMRRNDIKLEIIGNKPLANTFQIEVDSLGLHYCVYFRGFVSKLYIYIIRTDALLLTSHYGGFPNVVLEALDSNTPIIGTPAIGDLAEIIGGMNACVMAYAFKAENITSAIEGWINIQPKSIGEDVTAKNDVNIIVQRYENEFRKVLACD